VREPTDGGATSGRTFFVWISWLPLASFVATNVYVDRFDGWGQWAAAPMLLAPILLSLVVLVVGALAVRDEQLRGGARPSTWAALALASVPCLWLVWRLVVTL
jgi:hypothetical protein